MRWPAFISRGVRKRPLAVGGDHLRLQTLGDYEVKWGRDDFKPLWQGRGVAKEVVEAAESGWFAPGWRVLEIGCGEGENAAWMAERGFPSLGVDFAAAAVERARKRFPERPGELEYLVHDICERPPPDRGFQILIDRCCFERIPERNGGAYCRNVLAVAAPDARMMLFMSAFRRGENVGDAGEIQRVTDIVNRHLGEEFEIERREFTWLDRLGGENTEKRLPGLVFRLVRR